MESALESVVDPAKNEARGPWSRPGEAEAGPLEMWRFKVKHEERAREAAVGGSGPFS